MSRAIWLASYPKSGNTWLRMLINALSLKPGESLDINNLPEGDGIASGRAPFDRISLIDSGLLTHDEIDGLRPRIYEALAQQALDEEDCRQGWPVRFVKAHDAYVMAPKGEPLLGGAKAAAGAILIVRDPRDVAPSLANHNGVTLDDAIALLNNREGAFSGATNRQFSQFRQRLLSWSLHAASWLDQRDIPVHVLRYEDLRADTAAALGGALAFAGLAIAEEELRRAVAAANFDGLRQQEQERGFGEWPAPKRAGNFFRRGVVGAWRDELTLDQVARIETEHAAMMRRLGYELAGAAASPREQ